MLKVGDMVRNWGLNSGLWPQAGLGLEACTREEAGSGHEAGSGADTGLGAIRRLMLLPPKVL